MDTLHDYQKDVIEEVQAQRKPMIVIIGSGPYDPHMQFGGKSKLVHMMMDQELAEFEVKYVDITKRERQDVWKQLSFDEVSKMRGFQERCVMMELANGCEDLVKPIRKLHGPSNHSKHSRQGRANRWR